MRFSHFAFALIMSLPLSAIAHEDIPQRINHYEVQTPKTGSQARELIKQKIGEIEKYEKQGKLESIHEDSYYLEAAVETLRKEGKSPAKSLDAFDEAVQIMHYASETGEAKKVKEILPTLKNSAAALVSGNAH